MRTRLRDALAIRAAAFALLGRDGSDVTIAGYPVRAAVIGGLQVQRYDLRQHGDVLDIYPAQTGNKLFSMRQMPDGELIITSFKRGEWERVLVP
jgi:hypothetical protein